MYQNKSLRVGRSWWQLWLAGAVVISVLGGWTARSLLAAVMSRDFRQLEGLTNQPVEFELGRLIQKGEFSPQDLALVAERQRFSMDSYGGVHPSTATRGRISSVHVTRIDGSDIELLLDHFTSHHEPPAPTDDPTTLRLAIRNVGDTTISGRQHTDTFQAGTLCVKRPDDTVIRSRNIDQIVRGDSPRDTKPGELTLDANRGRMPAVFDTPQLGRYSIWWESAKHKSNTLVFERSDAGWRRIVEAKKP